MEISLSDLSSPVSALLYQLGLNPNMSLFWILYYTASIMQEDPEAITAIRCRLYPEVSKLTGLSPYAIDNTLRRAAISYTGRGKYRALCPYLPRGAERPTPSEILSAWLRMVAENGVL